MDCWPSPGFTSFHLMPHLFRLRWKRVERPDLPSMFRTEVLFGVDLGPLHFGRSEPTRTRCRPSGDGQHVIPTRFASARSRIHLSCDRAAQKLGRSLRRRFQTTFRVAEIDLNRSSECQTDAGQRCAHTLALRSQVSVTLLLQFHEAHNSGGDHLRFRDQHDWVTFGFALFRLRVPTGDKGDVLVLS